MFTGIITDVGKVLSIKKQGDWTFNISTSYDMDTVDIGASIACNGVCLTVTDKNNNSFCIQASQETLDKTTLKFWEEGNAVNLERSLKMGDELGGHLVFGHVDGLAEIVSITPEQESHRFVFRVPKDLSKYIAPKGSVSLDGISLTVNEVDKNVFGVNIISHTWNKTNLGSSETGQKLNLEIDMLARYVARMMAA